MDLLVKEWENQVDRKLAAATVAPGFCVEHTLTCKENVLSPEDADEAIEKMTRLYTDAGWKEVLIGPPITSAPGSVASFSLVRPPYSEEEVHKYETSHEKKEPVVKADKKKAEDKKETAGAKKDCK